MRDQAAREAKEKEAATIKAQHVHPCKHEQLKVLKNDVGRKSNEMPCLQEYNRILDEQEEAKAKELQERRST